MPPESEQPSARWRQCLLLIAVAVAGASVMLIELLGVRMLAPHVGTSVYVWTSIIGVILACLSIGYAIGGLIADSRWFRHALPLTMGAAGVMTGTLAAAYNLVPMSFIGYDRVITRSLVASALCFGPVTTVLGAVTPLAVRQMFAQGKIGRAAGSVYAVSTLGSIAGTFLAGFWLIPNFSMQTLLLGTAAILIAAAFLTEHGNAHRKQWRVLLPWIVAGLLLWGGTAVLAHGAKPKATGEMMRVLSDINTPYRRALIWETLVDGKRVRVLADWQSATFIEEELRDIPFPDYIKTFRLAEHYNPSLSRALLIGGAGYIFPRFFLQWYPDHTLDVVEIDPAMPGIAEEYFFYRPDPRIRSIVADGRVYVNETKETYDVVYLDAHAPEGMPFHLLTKEAFEQMARILSPNGVLIVNIVASTDNAHRELFESVTRTLQAVFPYVRPFVIPPRADPWNIVIVAAKQPGGFAAANDNREITRMLQYDDGGEIAAGSVFTDSFAPVEYGNITGNIP